MSKPGFQFTTPPGDNQESWDADALSNFIRVYKVLQLGPWPIAEFEAPSQLPPPGSFDRCIAVVGTGTQRWVYLSNGSTWSKIGRQAPFQADSTATTVAGLRADFNAFIDKLRNSGWMRGSEPDDPFSLYLSRMAVETWANVTLIDLPRLTRIGAEVWADRPPVLETIALTRMGGEAWATYTAEDRTNPSFPRAIGGFLSPNKAQITASQGARWETDGRYHACVVWHHNLGGPWVAKLRETRPNAIVIASGGEHLLEDLLSTPGYEDWFLRTSGGAPFYNGPPVPQFNATNAYGVLLPDPVTRPAAWTLPPGNISSATFIARQIWMAARPDLFDWDGYNNDWFWENLLAGVPDYNRDGVEDAYAVANPLYQEDRIHYLEAMRAVFAQVCGRDLMMTVNPGTASAGSYLLPALSAYGSEGWIWTPYWWGAYQALRTSMREDLGLPNKLGMFFYYRQSGFNALENNYLAVDDAVTYRTNEPPSAVNASDDPQRKINMRCRYHGFPWVRFCITLACLGDGWVSMSSIEHGISLDYDEFGADLGQPLSEYPWRIAKGPVAPGRVPNSDPNWPADELTGATNLYGAVFVMPFERGCVLHYVPRNYLQTTVNVTATDIQTAYTALGLGTAPTLYRIRSAQAPVQVFVGACQDLADNDNLFGRETVGTWNATTKTSWLAAAADNSLGVNGQVAYWKAAGSGSNTLRWRFRIDVTDDYEVFVKHPVAGSPSSPGYLTAYETSPGVSQPLFTHGAVATDATYTVQHDDGGGSKTTTGAGPINLNDKVRGHRLGTFHFVAGEDYYVELSDDADGIVVADGIYLQSVNARHNDGTAFSSQRMFGGVASVREYNPTNATYKPVSGDGLVLRTTPNHTPNLAGIVGNFPCHDTTPGTNHRECLYVGAWEDASDPTHVNDTPPADWPIGDVSQDNPYFARQVWGFELFDVHQVGYRKIAAGTSGAKARYIYRVCFAGSYVIQEWHGWVGKDVSGAECSSVPYAVKVNDVSQFTGSINQSTNFGRWNNVRTVLNLQVGDVVELELNAATATGGTVVISDAVRFFLL